MDGFKSWLSTNWKHLATTGIIILAAVHETYDVPDAKLFGLITSVSVILGIYAGHTGQTDKTTPQS